MKVLDTTFLIDLIRGQKDTAKIMDSNEPLLTTQINMYEVIRGMFIRNVSEEKYLQISEFFDQIRLLSLDDNSIIKSAEISSELIKNGQFIGDADCLTAGIALSNGVTTIVTRNVEHFKRIKGIKVESY
ncbi:TPA: type II toxin-antitoxin system VapC family toxin [Candidatus Woesearchaeota archaeon]|nr:type II toxin-antitoxin system VapC family toxin [Candidatus Woesearchaeota archaeon]